MRSRGAKSEEAAVVAAALCGGCDVSTGADAGLELCRFGVGGAKLQGQVDLALGSGEVASAQQGDGEVVVIVRVVGIGGGGALKERNGIVALAAGGDGLIVDDFGKGKSAGDEGEG